MTAPFGVRTSYSAQSRLKMMPLLSVLSTFERIDRMSKRLRVMLIEFGDAFDYSASDFEKWCREIGFKRFDVIHLAGPSSAAIAYK